MADPRIDRHQRIQSSLAARPTRPFVVQEPRTFAERLRIIARTCAILGRAHAGGIVHREVRPATIVVDEHGDADMIGWESASVGDDDDTERTTPARSAYSAPEHGKRRLDARADVYSLGTILLEVIALEAVPPPELELACARAIIPDPAQRLGSARELGAVITSFLDGHRDVALRQGLAHELVVAATRAFEAGDDAGGTLAASRALALDPLSRPAADLLVHTSNQPLPDEVRQLMKLDIEQALPRVARTAMWAYVGYILFAPAFLWLASGEVAYALGLLVLVAINIALLATHAFTNRRLPEISFVLANAGLVALIGRVTSPFLLAPGIAAVTATALAASPRYLTARSIAVVIVTLSAAVVLPWVGEVAGWLPPTMTTVKDGLMFRAAGMHLREGTQNVLLLFYVPTLIGAAAGLAFGFVQRERHDRYRVYLQLWMAQHPARR